jgi:hypothetical protein
MAYGPLDDNPPNSTIHLTKGVSAYLYAVTGIFAVETIVMACWARKRARGTRIFHQLATIILGKYWKRPGALLYRS